MTIARHMWFYIFIKAKYFSINILAIMHR